MGLETVVNIADLNPLWPLGGDPASTSDDHHRNIKTALLNDFAGFTGAILVTGVDGGAADAYTLTPAHAVVAYTAKMLIEFMPTATNLTATPTINISGLGAKTIKTVANAAVLPGDLVLGTPTLLAYDGINARLLGPTKNYIDQLAFGSALPALVADYILGADSTGTVAAFTNLLKATVIRFKDGSDATKLFAFDLASLTTATTRTAKVPDFDFQMGSPYLKVSEQRASGTHGGGSAAADITQTRVLNTVESNSITNSSLASNQITLPSGSYIFKARAPHYNGTTHKAFLYNVTDSTYAGVGSNAYSISGGSTGVSDSVIYGKLTISSSKVFSIRHYTTAAVATNGLGVAVSSGQVEVYSEIEFVKVA